MFRLVRSASVKTLLAEQALPLAASFVLAELLYKFHSFTLECLAFLVTWGLLDAALAVATAKLLPSRQAERLPPN